MTSLLRGMAAFSLLMLAGLPAGARETQALLRVSVIVPAPPCAVTWPAAQAREDGGPRLAVSCNQAVPLVVSATKAGGPTLVVAGPQHRLLPMGVRPLQDAIGGVLLLTY